MIVRQKEAKVKFLSNAILKISFYMAKKKKNYIEKTFKENQKDWFLLARAPAAGTSGQASSQHRRPGPAAGTGQSILFSWGH